MPTRSSLLLALLLALPAPARAQSSVSFGPFLGSSGGVDGRPTVLGLSATPRWGVLGLRASAAMDAAASPVGGLFRDGRSAHSDAWSGDLDLLLAPGRWQPIGALLGSWDPYLFVGLGVHGGRAEDGETATVAGRSWGIGAGRRLFSWLSLETEARRRLPLSDPGSAALHVGDGWDLRVGLSFEVRTGRRAARGAPSPRLPAREVPRSFDDASVPLDATRLADRTLTTAESLLGTRYVWGGDSPGGGFDCSGFVQYVYGLNGIPLPRTSRQQARAGEALPTRLSDLAPGDLLVFAGDGRRVDHVAIYAGDGRILHSSRSGQGVRYDDLSSPRGRWYVDHLVGVRRVIGAGGLLGTPMPAAEDGLLGEPEPVDGAPPPGP